ncbi:baseplate assembly protein [Malaciobacter canalis]|uniref:Baseplate assembly protein n=1 Tax=Malaciobacter canalis TaxID=1912871 RepID=A0ABX4LQV7_9BACT|nr:phage baseplate assembly protein V [Malaciobacter canalis]PHO10327.1 baseplate assembly protein [Malaciobacter canalis]QEE32432.1 phage baseplate assembly protein V [Malaciobacter canalis]
MSFAELKRLIDNLVNFGTISETKSADGKALARVKVSDRETDFLPIASFSNSFKRHFIPARVGEQVVVISPFGEANGGFILRSIFNKHQKEPSGSNDHTEVIEYEDGTRFSYDIQAKVLTVDCVGDINIKAGGNINFEAGGNIGVKATNTNFDGGSVTHNDTPMDDTHDHTQTAGDHFGAGGVTTPPNG